MATIQVNEENLKSAEAYIRSVINRIQNAPGLGGTPRDMTVENDLKRALQCLDDSRKTDEDLNAAG